MSFATWLPSIRPRHSLESVLTELVDGLQGGSVVLETKTSACIPEFSKAGGCGALSLALHKAVQDLESQGREHQDEKGRAEVGEEISRQLMGHIEDLARIIVVSPHPQLVTAAFLDSLVTRLKVIENEGASSNAILTERFTTQKT